MNARTPKIVVAESYTSSALERLRAVGEVVELDAHDDASLKEAVTGADALLVRTYAQVTDSVMEAAPKLRVIGRGGVGLDNIDLRAATGRGITVVYTPGASMRSAAEQTAALLLAVWRDVIAADTAARGGDFAAYRKAARFTELEGRTVGIVGMGRIGSTVAGMLNRGFGLSVLYNDIIDVGPFEFDAQPVSKERLYGGSDIVSLHVPLTSLTRHLIDEAALTLFKPGAVLLNASRGAVLDGEAVAAALRSGRLGGAGVDVFEPEPPPAGHPLLGAPRVVLSPHVAGRSDVALARMNDVVDDVIAVLEGRPPRYPYVLNCDQR